MADEEKRIDRLITAEGWVFDEVLAKDLRDLANRPAGSGFTCSHPTWLVFGLFSQPNLDMDH